MAQQLDYVDMSMGDSVNLNRVQVYHNGEKLNRVYEALAGENGYAMYHAEPLRESGGEIMSGIADGNIEIILEDE